MQAPVIELSPPYIEVAEYTPAQAECRATGNDVAYHWTRINGELSPDTWVSDGLLRFNGVRRSDIGEYRCVARNQFGEDSRILNVYVRSDQPRPPRPQPSELVIQPSHFSGRPGAEVVLQCQDISNPQAVLTWRKDGQSSLPRHIYTDNGVLTIQQASLADSGRYVCANARAPSVTQSVDVQISSGGGGGNREQPQIKKFDDLYNVIQGHDFSLVCEASGYPVPSVRWQKVHEELDSNAQVIGNILRISNAQPPNRGVYTCVAESDGGIVEESTVIDIERK